MRFGAAGRGAEQAFLAAGQRPVDVDPRSRASGSKVSSRGRLANRSAASVASRTRRVPAVRGGRRTAAPGCARTAISRKRLKKPLASRCRDEPQQLVFGDVADDRDVRVGRADRRVLGDRLQAACRPTRCGSPGLRVFPSRARTLRICANSASMISRRLSLEPLSPGVGSRTSKISPSPLDSPDEMHCSRNAVDLAEERLDVVPGGALRPLPTGRQDRELVEVMAGRLDGVVDVGPAAAPKATRNWTSSAIGSASVCGAVRSTNSPARPCSAASPAVRGQVAHPARPGGRARAREHGRERSRAPRAARRVSSRWRWLSSSAARSRARTEASLARWRTGSRAGAACRSPRSASISARKSAWA